jgi:hypothetical protein
MDDCLVTGNFAGQGGGGIATYSWTAAELVATGCTISQNSCGGSSSPASSGGGLLLAGGTAHLTRTILWGNCSSMPGNEAKVSSLGTLSCTCSVVDWAGVAGDGAIFYDTDTQSADPLFCAPLSCQEAPAEGGDYTASTLSPCLPETSPCDERIGARESGCSPPTPTVPGSWGRLKGRYFAPAAR